MSERETEMSEIIVPIAITLFVAGVLIYAYQKYQKIVAYRVMLNKPKLLQHVLIKLMVNPFDEDKWYWTRFNPKTRTWHWVRVANDAEVLAYKDLILTEEIGNQVIQLGENSNG